MLLQVGRADAHVLLVVLHRREEWHDGLRALAPAKPLVDGSRQRLAALAKRAVAKRAVRLRRTPLPPPTKAKRRLGAHQLVLGLDHRRAVECDDLVAHRHLAGPGGLRARLDLGDDVARVEAEPKADCRLDERHRVGGDLVRRVAERLGLACRKRAQPEHDTRADGGVAEQRRQSALGQRPAVDAHHEVV